jgi:hypothetical protein
MRKSLDKPLMIFQTRVESEQKRSNGGQRGKGPCDLLDGAAREGHRDHWTNDRDTWAVTEGKDPDWNVMLQHVYPDGRAERIQDGVMKAFPRRL